MMLTRGPPESPWQESLPGAAAQSILPVIWDHVCVVVVDMVVVVDVVDVDVVVVVGGQLMQEKQVLEI